MAEMDSPDIRPLCAVMAYSPLDMKTDPAEKFHPERDMPAERARNYNALYCTPRKGRGLAGVPHALSQSRLAAMPRTLVVTAADDSLAPEGEAFAQKLARAGVETTCKRFQHCVHGFFINRMDAWEEGIELIHRYLKQALEEAAQ